MRISFALAFFAFAGLRAVPCSAQRVAVVPDIAVTEAEYRDANEAALQNDPNLERDLFRVDSEQVRQRIHRAAALRDEAMVKKDVYLTAVISRLQNLRTGLNTDTGGMIATAALKKSLEAQQAKTLDEQAKVEEQMRDLGEGDEYLLVRKALDEERKNLINVQNNLALRIRSIDNLDKAQKAIQNAAGSNESLSQKFDEVVKLWQQERDSTARQREHWSHLYVVMEQALEKKAAPLKKGKKSSDAAPPPPSIPPIQRARGLTGTWIYRSQPGAWTGYEEPLRVTLDLRPDRDTLRGTYAARLAVRSGYHDVLLALAGPWKAGNAVRLHWISQRPAAEGEMELKLAGDGRLLVERSQSSDAYIPHGMEVLLPQ